MHIKLLHGGLSILLCFSAIHCLPTSDAESYSPALRSAPDLDIMQSTNDDRGLSPQAVGDIKIHQDSPRASNADNKTLQARAILPGSMTAFHGAQPLAFLGGYALREAAPAMAYSLMALSIAPSVVNIVTGMDRTLHEWSLRRLVYEDEKEELEHRRWKRRREKEKARIDDIDRQIEIIRDSEEDWRTWQTYGLEFRQLEEELKEQIRKNQVADSLAKYEKPLATLGSLIKEGDESKAEYDKAVAEFETAKKSPDPHSLKTSLDKVDQHWTKAIEIHNRIVSDYKTLVKQLGGQNKADETILEGLVKEHLKEEHMPGSFPRRRRRQLRSHGLPQLIGEKNTNCETEYCHRTWYSIHKPEVKRRSLLSSRFSPDLIHDVHFTPLDFEFRDDGTLQRRADAPGNSEEETFHEEDDCNFDVVADASDGRSTSLHSRLLVQYGGDSATLQIFGLWGPEEFLKRWFDDINKLPTVTEKGQTYNSWLTPGLNCWKFDLNGGDPAIYLTYTISTTTEYSQANPGDLTGECKKQLG